MPRNPNHKDIIKNFCTEDEILKIFTGLSVLSFPIKDPEKTYQRKYKKNMATLYKPYQWRRNFGSFELFMVSGEDYITMEKYGLPFGNTPRLILVHLINECLKTRSKEIVFDNIKDLMLKLFPFSTYETIDMI